MAFNLSTGGATIIGATPTLLFLNPPAAPGQDLIFMRFWVGQSNNMASAQQRVQLNTQATAFPTLTAATPAKMQSSGGASVLTGGTAGAAGTCGIIASAEGAGTRVAVLQDVFNVVNGWLLVLTPSENYEQSAGQATGIGLNLPVAPGTLTNWAFGCTWIES